MLNVEINNFFPDLVDIFRMLVTWTLNKPSKLSVAVTRLADFVTDIRQIITSIRMEITRLQNKTMANSNSAEVIGR